MGAKILLIDDDSFFIKTLRHSFSERPAEENIEWVTSGDGRSGVQAFLAQRPFDAVVIDVHLPDMTGADVAALIRRIRPDQQILFCTGDETKETLSHLLSTGLANGFLAKFDKKAALTEPILRAISNFKKNLRVLSSADMSPGELSCSDKMKGWVGRSTALHQIKRQVANFRNLPGNVLVLGETGAGKEGVAQALAQDSQSVLSINCSKFKDNPQLAESEFFGSVKGAYTGALMDKPGLFESAHGGILFFDEIHLLPVSAQDLLLRVIELKKVRRLGDTSAKERSVNFRLVAAGQPALLQMRESGAFKPDLYYRIAALRIDVPPLRERLEDIEPIAVAFTEELSTALKRKRYLRAGTVRLMEEYSWPGNIRELKLAMERMMSTTDQKWIEPQDFVDFLEQETTRQLLKHEPQADFTHEAYMQLKETEYFREILANSPSQSEAAKKAGLSSSTFYFRLKKLGLTGRL